MRPSWAALDPLAVCGDLWRIMDKTAKLGKQDQQLNARGVPETHATLPDRS